MPAVKMGAASRGRPSRALRIVRSYGVSLLVVGLIFVVWQFVVPEALTRVLPRPLTIVQAIVRHWPGLWKNLLYTLQEAVLGFILGSGIAIILAVTFIYSRPVANTVYPMAVVLRSIPLVALLPVIVIFFGQGTTSRVVVAALICFFPTLVNMVQGLTSVPIEALELMYTLDASERQLFWKMRVPYSLPHLFTSFRITSSAAVLGAMIGEWMGVWRGLGSVIVQAMFNMRGDQLWAAMVVATMLSVAAYAAMTLLERVAIPWHASVRRAKAGEE